MTRAARTRYAVGLFDVRIAPAGQGEIAIPDVHNAVVVLLRGCVIVNGAAVLQGEAQIAALNRGGSALELEARSDSMLVLLSGEPIDEPVVRHEHPGRGPASNGGVTAGRMGRLQ